MLSMSDIFWQHIDIHLHYKTDGNMKTLVDFDFGWALNACLLYASRQAALMGFFDDNNIDISDALDIIRLASSRNEAIEKLKEQFGMGEMVAKELLGMPLSRITSLSPKEDMEYFIKLVVTLSPLAKQATGR